MYRGGERIRVPNPDDGDTVAAEFVGPSEPTRRHAEFVWVRYLEGPRKDQPDRILYSEVEPA